MFLRGIPRAVAAVLLCAGVSVGGFLTSATTASAASTCDSTVVDGANMFGGNVAPVQQAAQKLVSTVNADVRVVTVQDYSPYATLDKYLTHVLQTCPSWQAPDGKSAKSNLLVFAAAYNPKHSEAMFFGTEWVNAFSGDNSETRIYTDFMVPAFKVGNFTKGFTDAMNESQRVLNNFLHPGSQPIAQTNSKSSSGHGGDF